jgi:hypothetical protein
MAQFQKIQFPIRRPNKFHFKTSVVENRPNEETLKETVTKTGKNAELIFI